MLIDIWVIFHLLTIVNNAAMYMGVSQPPFGLASYIINTPSLDLGQDGPTDLALGKLIGHQVDGEDLSFWCQLLPKH